MTQLPLEIWNKIFSGIDNEYDLFFISRVNKQFLALLMSNNFWIYHFHDNFKYAKFDVYNSICEFVNIHCRMYKFLNQKRWLVNNDVSAIECVLNNIENFNAPYITYQYIVPNVYFYPNHPYKIDQNDYCCVIIGYNIIGRMILIYNNFLPDDNPNKHIIFNKNGEYFGNMEKWDFKIYGNYIWYIHEKFNGINKKIDVTFFAKNIITGKIHKIYTYDDEYDTSWPKCGHWEFNDTNTELIIYKNI